MSYKITFQDLSADELAEHAFNVFLFQGRHPLGARLVFEALRQNETHSLGLRCLADLLNQEGMEVFSAVTLEYALVHADLLSEDEGRALARILFASKWSWGFSKHKSGTAQLKPEDFNDASAFVIDHDRYQAFLQTLLSQTESLENAFKSAHTLCGIMGQFLQHIKPELTTQFTEIFYPERFELKDTYRDWLQSYEPALDEMAAKRFVRNIQQLY